MSLPSFILQMSIWSILIPLAAGIFFYKRLDRDSLIIFYLVIWGLVPQVLTFFYLHTDILNLFYNIYTPVEFLLIYFFIGNKFQLLVLKRLSTFIVLLFIVASFVLMVKYGIRNRFLNEWVCFANTAYLCWILLFILESLINEKKLLNTHLPMFWYLSALLIYTPCTFFVFSLYPFINNSHSLFLKNLWTIHGVFNTVLYLFYAIGLCSNNAVKNITLGKEKLYADIISLKK